MKKLLKALKSFINVFRRKPLTEIRHDLEVVKTFFERAQASQNVLNLKNQAQIVQSIENYLTKAGKEHDFAQAWTYINLADAELTLVVPEEELKAVASRLQVLDEQLFHKGKTKNDVIESISKKIADIEKKQSNIGSAVHRELLHTLQLARAQIWNSQNRKISLKKKLWGSVGLWVFISLVLSVLVAIFFNNPVMKSWQGNPEWFKYIYICILGFFGGALSVYIKINRELVESTSYRLIKRNTKIRMLFGAAGAFVVYIAAHWLLDSDITAKLDSNVYVFLSVGIASGFSEKLFSYALEKIANNLSVSATPLNKETQK